MRDLERGDFSALDSLRAQAASIGIDSAPKTQECIYPQPTPKKRYSKSKPPQRGDELYMLVNLLIREQPSSASSVRKNLNIGPVEELK